MAFQVHAILKDHHPSKQVGYQQTTGECVHLRRFHGPKWFHYLVGDTLRCPQEWLGTPFLQTYLIWQLIWRWIWILKNRGNKNIPQKGVKHPNQPNDTNGPSPNVVKVRYLVGNSFMKARMVHPVWIFFIYVLRGYICSFHETLFLQFPNGRLDRFGRFPWGGFEKPVVYSNEQNNEMIPLQELIGCLGGGFKYFLCSPLFREDSHFD